MLIVRCSMKFALKPARMGERFIEH